jgi:hypothetical protein
VVLVGREKQELRRRSSPSPPRASSRRTPCGSSVLPLLRLSRCPQNFVGFGVYNGCIRPSFSHAFRKALIAPGPALQHPPAMTPPKTNPPRWTPLLLFLIAKALFTVRIRVVAQADSSMASGFDQVRVTTRRGAGRG